MTTIKEAGTQGFMCENRESFDKEMAARIAAAGGPYEAAYLAMFRDCVIGITNARVDLMTHLRETGGDDAVAEGTRNFVLVMLPSALASIACSTLITVQRNPECAKDAAVDFLRHFSGSFTDVVAEAIVEMLGHGKTRQ